MYKGHCVMYKFNSLCAKCISLCAKKHFVMCMNLPRLVGGGGGGGSAGKIFATLLV